MKKGGSGKRKGLDWRLWTRSIILMTWLNVQKSIGMEYYVHIYLNALALHFSLFRAFDDENCLCGEKLHTSRGLERESFDRMRGKYFCSFPHPLLLPPLPSYRCLHPASWSTSLPPSPRLLRFPSFAEFAATTRADSGWKFGFSWHLSSPSGRQTLRRRGRPPCDHRTKQEVKSCLDFSNKKTFCCCVWEKKKWKITKWDKSPPEEMAHVPRHLLFCPRLGTFRPSDGWKGTNSEENSLLAEKSSFEIGQPLLRDDVPF